MMIDLKPYINKDVKVKLEHVSGFAIREIDVKHNKIDKKMYRVELLLSGLVLPFDFETEEQAVKMCEQFE